MIDPEDRRAYAQVALGVGCLAGVVMFGAVVLALAVKVFEAIVGF